jgi:DNA-binding transcriptional MerR regulator
MRAGLTIGEFAQLTQLSVRTLRRYHEGGLLAPATVDPGSGYRYYTTEQIPAAQIIHRLRELGMPLREVGEMLATPDPDSRAALVAAHLGRLESELERTRTAVTSLRRLLQPEPRQLAVELRAEPARTVAAITGIVDRTDLVSFFHEATAELATALAGQELTGPPGGTYDNELFTKGRGRAVVYHRVEHPPAVGRLRPFTLPAAELAVTVHRGTYSELDISYGQLGAYVTDHALAVAGPVREAYLVGSRDTADPDSWRTEIGWPIFRVSPI